MLSYRSLGAKVGIGGKPGASYQPANEFISRFLQEFFDPITLSLITDPVVAEDGFTYERWSIQEYFLKNEHVRSPKTNNPMGQTLRPNQSVKNLITHLVDKKMLPDDIMKEWISQKKRKRQPLRLSSSLVLGLTRLPEREEQSLEQRAHTSSVMSVCSIDETRIASGSWDHTIKIWNVDNNTVLNTLRDYDDRVACVCKLDANRLASNTIDGKIKIWNVDDGTVLLELLGHRVCKVDADRLASSFDYGRGPKIFIWNVETGVGRQNPLEKRIVQMLHETDEVSSICSIHATQIASGLQNGTIKIWNVENGKVLHTLNSHTRDVYSICLVDFSRIASASSDHTIKIWNVNNGKKLRTLEGHNSDVNSVCSIGSNRIASASSDETIKIWKVDNGTLLNTLQAETEVFSVCSVDSTVDSTRIASGSGNNTVKIWSFETDSRAASPHPANGAPSPKRQRTRPGRRARS